MDLSTLSPECLVQADLVPAPCPVRAWRSPLFDRPANWRPWLLASTSDGADAQCAQGRVGWLEMYGGAGVGANAGGVRCANVDGWQLKGVGASILAGRTTDHWHRHGAMSVQDAVKEAVWGELFEAASPGSAVRCGAVFDLGLRFATEIGEAKTPSSAPQAVLCRQIPVRIAHFLRSSFIDAGDVLAARDVSRMQSGIPRLADWLRAQAPVQPGEPLAKDGLESLIPALVAVYGATIDQLAVLRTKRLIHGSLIPSNLSLDGRLLDFTTATAVSTLQPFLVSPGGYASDHQQLQALDSLEDLVFYLAKFDPRLNHPRTRCVEVGEEIRRQLIARHVHSLKRAHARLTGFSAVELAALPPALVEALADHVLMLVRAGDTRVRLYYGGDEHTMPPASEKDDPFAAIAAALLAGAGLPLPRTDRYAPRPEAFGVERVACLTATIRAASCWLDGGSPHPRRTLTRVFRAMQWHADLEPLYRRRLDGDIHAVVDGGLPFAPFIDDTLTRWRDLLRTPDDGQVTLTGWLTDSPWRLDAQGDVWQEARSSTLKALGCAPAAKHSMGRHRWLFDLLLALNDET